MKRRYEVVLLEKNNRGYIVERYDKISNTELNWLCFKKIKGKYIVDIIGCDKIFKIRIYDDNINELYDSSCDIVSDMLKWKKERRCEDFV